MDKRDAIKQRWKERTASKRFKLPEGETTFRVLPNAKGLDKFAFVEYAMHSNVGSRKAYLRCGSKKAGEDTCWLCGKIEELSQSKKQAARDAADRMKRKEAFAVQIAYVSEGKWVGPVLWEMPVSVANKLLGIMSRRDIENPEKGYNLTITRQGTGMTDTRYGDIDKDDEPSAAPTKVMASLQAFGEVVRKYDEALQKKEFFGHETEEDITSDEPAAEEEEAPKPTAKKKPAVVEDEDEAPKPAKKKPVPEPEEEEPSSDDSAEDDLFGGDDIPDLDEEESSGEENTEEEEEAPKPASKKSGKAKPTPDEEPEPVVAKRAGKPAKSSKPAPPEDDDF